MTVFARGSFPTTVTLEQVDELAVHRWVPDGQVSAKLAFACGFMGTPSDYSQLFEHIASHGIEVIVPPGDGRDPRALFGPTPASVLAERLAAVGASQGVDALVGHSRGGQVAWLASAMVNPDVLVVIDPVDGEGRKPATPVATAAPATFDARTCVVGAEPAGRCSPDGFNHPRFAAMAPAHSKHLLFEMGHADVLNERVATFGRWLCGGAGDPDPARRTVAGVIVGHVLGIQEHGYPIPRIS